ncbi:MAG: RNA polymerase sigma factor [Kiritimatiellae bacterium]|nr:RNA polymerase sigma factor [Kiritimatiellia bacterium]
MRSEEKLRKMFELLVAEHAPMLVSYLCALTGSRPDAEDLAQETFLKAYRNFERFETKGGNFPGWLRRIGRNLFIDKFRRSKKVVFSDPEILEGIEDMFSGMDRHGTGDTWPEQISSLRECLTRLPEGLGSVCRFHYFEGLTAKIIAGRLGVTLAAVLKRLERARAALRECMERKLGLSPRESKV